MDAAAHGDVLVPVALCWGVFLFRRSLPRQSCAVEPRLIITVVAGRVVTIAGSLCCRRMQLARTLRPLWAPNVREQL